MCIRDRLGSLSHEIRDAVGFIAGTARSILSSVGDSDIGQICTEVKCWANLIAREIANADLFRSWPQNYVPALETVNPERVLKEGIGDCTQILERIGVSSSVIDLPSVVQPKAIRTDEDMFAQIVFNLLSNAIQYHKPREIPAVRIDIGLEFDRICFDVVDWGIGIAKEFRTKIFEPGFRSPGAHLSYTHGEGLGLWVASCLANVLEGDITVQHFLEPTVVRLRLPFTSEARHRATGLPDANIWPSI